MEVVLLMVLALLVFGPKRLPEIARQVGRAVAEVRKASREFEREVRDMTDPFAKELREAERLAKQTYRMDEDHSSYAPRPRQTPPSPSAGDGESPDGPPAD